MTITKSWILLALGAVLVMILGLVPAASAQEIVEEEAPVQTGEEVPVGDERPIRDEELPPAPEPEPAEDPVVEPVDDGIVEPLIIGPAEEQSVISPGAGTGETNEITGWEWAGIIGAGLASLVGGFILGALLMRGYDRHHPLTH